MIVVCSEAIVSVLLDVSCGVLRHFYFSKYLASEERAGFFTLIVLWLPVFRLFLEVLCVAVGFSIFKCGVSSHSLTFCVACEAWSIHRDHVSVGVVVVGVAVCIVTLLVSDRCINFIQTLKKCQVGQVQKLG